MPMLTIALTFLFAINILTIVRFGMDKSYARNGQRRIPETDLLALALVGGSPGALLARRLFRHKTRKEPFSSHLWTIVFLHVIVVGAAGGFLLAG